MEYILFIECTATKMRMSVAKFDSIADALLVAKELNIEFFGKPLIFLVGKSIRLPLKT